MAYAPTNLYTPSDPAIQNSFFYPPSLSLLPGEATSTPCFYGPSDITSSSDTLNLVHPGPLTPRRRTSHSNNSYPYPTSHYDASRSPTRSRFYLHDPNMPSPENIFHSPTRSRFPLNGGNLLSPERHNKPYGRPSYGDGVSQNPRKPLKVPKGPTNHVLIPQALFQEAASSKSYYYRYPEIMFHVANFPEAGVKVGALNRTKIPLLSGAEDPVLRGVQEREIKVRILWPGYSAVTFERRLKTDSTRRLSVLIKLAQMVLEFASHLRLIRAQVDPGQEQWMIDGSGILGICCSDVFITKLVHCGGSHWQMELWAPQEMIQAK